MRQRVSLDNMKMAPRRRRSVLKCLIVFFTGFSLGCILFTKPLCRSDFLGEALSTSISPPSKEEKGDSLRKLEESQRNLIFVGVMTAQKYLPTRAVTVYDTWGKDLPGKIAFFSSEYSRHPEGRPDLPLVPLRGVDDSYPPQKKSFLMLQYMWEHYGNQFEWFLRADDDVFIRPDKLEKLLRSVDSKKAFFIGQAGRGNQEEFGLLSLEFDENFCMGGPGVILSRETLSRISPHIKKCLKNLYTTHEDVELGRCVKKFAGIPCTWSYEMQTIFYHNSSGQEAFTGNLKQKEVHRAITLHPVKQYKHLGRIYNYMKFLEIRSLEHKAILLERDIHLMMELLNQSQPQNSVISVKPGLSRYKPTKLKELIPWEIFQKSLYSAKNSNPRRKLESYLKEGLDDVVREVMELTNKFSKQRGRVIDFREILYGYHRFNPLYGADYILDLLLIYRKYRGRKMTLQVRRHAYLQQQFMDMEVRELLTEESDSDLLSFKSSTDDTMINFIVPLAGRYEVFKRFIRNFERVCLMRGEKVSLSVVLFGSDDKQAVNATMLLIQELSVKYENSKIESVPVFKDFARALALEMGYKNVQEPNDLLFFVDVDILFDENALKRIRSNTVRGKQVYFPIVFSEFDPKFVYNFSTSPDHFVFDNEKGFWRQFGFGIASAYKSDLVAVGGFNTSIVGWGKEDVDLFDKFVRSNLNIFRAVDPGLVHVFHEANCDNKLDSDQMRMCKGSKADTFGSNLQLSKLISSSNGSLLSNFVMESQEIK